MQEIKSYSESLFEDIKHIDEYGQEFWYARELQKVLEYAKWEKFNLLIEKAKEACKNSDNNVSEQFPQVGKLIKLAKGATRKIIDYKLSRYACYLIVMNGDSRKEVIALGQTYFAYQTRKQELLEETLKDLNEDERRLKIREEVRKGNYGLNNEASKRGVKNMAEFTNAGYKGLYGGETANDIFKRKNLRYREDILDNMGSIELADNLFRIMQTEDKLKRENIDNEYAANNAHYEVGKNVRNVIIKNGGTLPEDLPLPEKSIKQLNIEKENNEIYLKEKRSVEIARNLLKQNIDINVISISTGLSIKDLEKLKQK